MDYSVYELTNSQKIKYIAQALIIVFVVALLFYRSAWVMAAAVIVVPFWLKRSAEECRLKRKQALNLQFREAMQSVSGALLAGYSLENAWKEAERDMRILYGDDGYMTKELHNMNQAISVNENIEDLIDDFGNRSDISDVKNFCQVMRFAKRSGGDFTGIIGKTVKKMGDKIEISKEIYTAMTSKRLESRIMNLVPLGVMFYVSISFGGYLDPLYHNLKGVMIMTMCLLVYMFGFWISDRIIRGVKV